MSITVPFTFAPGTVIQSAQVNADFNALASNARTILTAPTTFYVSPAGLDIVSGLDPSHPAATANYIIKLLRSAYDLNGQPVTIQFANGVYNQDIIVSGPLLGQGDPSHLIIQGNVSSPANVTINGTNHCFEINFGGMATIQGFTLQATGANGDGVLAWSGGIAQVNGIIWGACPGYQCASSSGATMIYYGQHTITGNSQAHIAATENSILYVANLGVEATALPTSVALTGTPTFSAAFAQSHAGSFVNIKSPTFSGTTTSKRIVASYNGTLVSDVVLPGAIMTNADCPAGGRYTGPEGNFPTVFMP
jgi:hypothetical protein